MEQIISLQKGWKVLQDVHDIGEKTGLYRQYESSTDIGTQISEWEPLEELKHLQLLYANQPYFGRELRYFNQAPWWYCLEFDIPGEDYESMLIRFTNVDYYAKVWLNGKFLGEHEGYSAPFSFETKGIAREGEKNYLIVKVSSPWDEEVEQDGQVSRTMLVKRNMVKGTYEHSDTFIQRDVNPVGIYGKVELLLSKAGAIAGDVEVDYKLDVDGGKADVTVGTALHCLKEGQKYAITVTIREKDSGLVREQKKEIFTAEKKTEDRKYCLRMEKVNLWSTWDHGRPWMYQAEAVLEKDGETLSRRVTAFAFRKIEIERNAETTRFWLNGKKIYIRGTSYYPDCYISAMTKERYLRDLLNVKAAGFNLVRVHVHTEQTCFYDLCDKLGIAVLQDSEYNWTHPSTDEWAERFANIFRDNVKLLKRHPSVICWIIMNEPGCVDPDGKIRERFMEENPGPRLYRELQEMDSERPIIKGSFCEDDLLSGDSHNYVGSLTGGEYGEIYGQTEKLNTEYGFDAPGCAENLKRIPSVYRRLESIREQIPEIQEYQYKLLKYYTEHYRIQKYAPCAGYVQFMFIDLCPQSFYGIYDWWGIPKKGLNAILESNAPVGIFAKHRDFIEGIYIVNDTDKAYKACTASWTVTEAESGKLIAQDSCETDFGADCCVQITKFPENYGKGMKWNLSLDLMDEQGNSIARNVYTDICTLLPHVKGHPERMSHEIGMRLYWA